MLRLAVCTFDWWYRSGMNYPFLLAIFLLAIFIFGSCLGSFLNVCIWRLPHGQSVINAPSHCTVCGYDIRWYDNLPIISYLVLGGRCRNCRAHYTARYLVVEALTGVLFVLLFIKVGLTQQPVETLLLYFPMTLLIITTAWIDTEHRLIPDATTYPALLWGIVIAAAVPSVWETENRLAALLMATISAAVTGGILSLFAILGRKIAHRDVLGWGDVKFMMATAALLGLPGAFFTLLAGSFSGAAAGAILAQRQRRGIRGFAIAFGPFLAGAALVWMFCGEFILRWYLRIINLAELAQ